MLDVLTGHQIILRPISQQDQRLKGQIILRNANNSRYLAYKVPQQLPQIKSTDIKSFQADPSKGYINPRQTITIPISTIDPVDMELAKTLSQNNKFLIQYGFMNAKPISIEEAISSLKSGISQSVKLYINTDSVRGSSIGKTMRQPSAVGSNRYSFHSMAPNANQIRQVPVMQSAPSANMDLLTPSSDQMDRLKYDIQSLEKQRARLLKDIDGKGKSKRQSVLKYIILLSLGLIAGNLGSKYYGLNTFLQNKILLKATQQHKVVVAVPQDEGFLSIFNWGGEDIQHEKRVVAEEKKAFWDFL